MAAHGVGPVDGHHHARALSHRLEVEHKLEKLYVCIWNFKDAKHPEDRAPRADTMLAHRHAQVWSGAALASALGESYPTVKRHVDLLTGSLVVRQLQPWLPNLQKRLVRSPKVFVRDSGLLHALLGGSRCCRSRTSARSCRWCEQAAASSYCRFDEGVMTMPMPPGSGTGIHA